MPVRFLDGYGWRCPRCNRKLSPQLNLDYEIEDYWCDTCVYSWQEKELEEIYDNGWNVDTSI